MVVVALAVTLCGNHLPDDHHGTMDTWMSGPEANVLAGADVRRLRCFVFTFFELQDGDYSGSTGRLDFRQKDEQLTKSENTLGT